jgi:hypothetical protein
MRALSLLVFLLLFANSAIAEPFVAHCAYTQDQSNRVVVQIVGGNADMIEIWRADAHGLVFADH